MTVSRVVKLLVLGGGLQGRIVARNLAERDDVTEVVLADVAEAAAALPDNVRFERVDARDTDAVKALAEDAAAAVTALPSAIGTVALPTLIDAGVPVVDVSFTEELPFHLDDAARDAGVPVVVDVGIAPGLSHVLAAALHREAGGLDALRILVGGMPLQPPPVFKHAIYFNARDHMDEYRRPARLRRNGRDESVDPLDADVLGFEDPEAGPLEGIITDGLRTLLASFPDVPDMMEVTLRIPGHVTVMRDLKALGLLDEESVDATAVALARRFNAEDHPDLLLMEVQGERGGEMRSFRVHTGRAEGFTAMSRCTAFTAAAAAMLLARRTFTDAGVHAPERLGKDATVTDALLRDVDAHGVPVVRAHRLEPAPSTRGPES